MQSTIITVNCNPNRNSIIHSLGLQVATQQTYYSPQDRVRSCLTRRIGDAQSLRQSSASERINHIEVYPQRVRLESLLIVGQRLVIEGGCFAHHINRQNALLVVSENHGHDRGLVGDGAHFERVVAGHQDQVFDCGHSDWSASHGHIQGDGAHLNAQHGGIWNDNCSIGVGAVFLLGGQDVESRQAEALETVQACRTA